MNEDTATTEVQELTERLERMEAKLEATQAALDELLEHARGQQDLVDEMRPVAMSFMRVASKSMARLEAKGAFTFSRAALGIAERIMEGYEPEDVDELGDSIVAILDTVRALTRPEILAMVQEGAETLEEAEDAAPIGIIGLARAGSDVNVQKGLGILVASLRHVGRASRVLTKKTGQLRKGAHPGVPATRKKVAATMRPGQDADADSCGLAPPSAVEAFPELGGVCFDRDGFLTDCNQWSEGLAEAIATDLGVAPLDERKWMAVRAARQTYTESGESPNIRKLTSASGLGTKELYALFPKAPGKTIARIAGIPKPVGCL